MFENENFLFFLSAKGIRYTEDIYSSAYQYELWSRVFRTLSMMGGIGIFVGGFILFLLVGSVALILY